MRIAVGSDHAGFFLKEVLEAFLEQEGHGVVDMGCDSPDPIDYPLIGRPVAEAVARGEVNSAILICGSGIGMSMLANKVKGVRAALVNEPFSARLAREHNDANVLCLGARMLGEDLACECTKVFLQTEFGGGRHSKRLELLQELDVGRGTADTFP
ncbi:MAG: ribose 5-phosphate isomerase B [Cyanobacteria bacterium NC_groundwater_1444_Ag_S-0.65um_54_12]|nr:ribose 5-phosphate isomerase B [Cyanobacteria bacterium NC_groundwater_1444_Ag_S-0.65um_54_12]